ncbi:hypothetical protein TREMEDRAFT_62114 [Tremella mesenterica DSM 1558]|uniref:uncharacterized protein n=1 Tax=Tremella mesenterica (strain ATCC 24925 / CBS 8224 / DSM 1558 / NBRC 9311 / NRRL Y-6157 / RJB 2259-6 / UBC 559-6) TaxID=578456 RepID=UPI0003F48E3F|nr:uncharacterized protein TREMEDRAFT_62114 [Tremella mesenterica DSM 1558]EIW69260.1 hypothetical protein TREMEDRAFT_62114 [Tremella mesenterica DSM 1558]
MSEDEHAKLEELRAHFSETFKTEWGLEDPETRAIQQLLEVNPVKDAVVTLYSSSDFWTLKEFRESYPGNQWDYVEKKPKDPVPSSSHHAETIPASHTPTSRWSSRQVPSHHSTMPTMLPSLYKTMAMESNADDWSEMLPVRASLESLRSFDLPLASSEQSPYSRLIEEFLNLPLGARAGGLATLSSYMVTAPTRQGIIDSTTQENQIETLGAVSTSDEPPNDGPINDSPETGTSSSNNPHTQVKETEGPEGPEGPE